MGFLYSVSDSGWVAESAALPALRPRFVCIPVLQEKAQEDRLVWTFWVCVCNAGLVL